MSIKVETFYGGLGSIQGSIESWMRTRENLGIISTNLAPYIYKDEDTDEERQFMMAMIYYTSDDII